MVSSTLAESGFRSCRISRAIALLLPVLALALFAGCVGGNLASRVAQTPKFEPEGQTRCG